MAYSNCWEQAIVLEKNQKYSEGSRARKDFEHHGCALLGEKIGTAGCRILAPFEGAVLDFIPQNRQ